MPITDERRAALAREILELTRPDVQHDDEITTRDYKLAAQRVGIIMTDRQARVALEKAVDAGTMHRRNIGRNVFYSKIVRKNETSEVQNTEQ